MGWVKWGSFFMFTGVAMGAFGAHALRGKITDAYLEVFKTGVLYHLIHALSLFAVAWLTAQGKPPLISLAGCFFSGGIILFSGSLYALSVTSIKTFGAITPLGGVSFLAGWALLFFSFLSTRS